MWLVLCSFLMLGYVSEVAAQGQKIAFVDLQRALNETNEGKKQMKKLKKDKDKLQKKIEKKEKEVLKMKEQIEKQQNILNKEALQKKVETYYQAMQELQQTYSQFQQELQAKEMKATQAIYVKMKKIVEGMGKSDGYTMIYDKTMVVWAPSHLDLTDKLIQKYNKKHK